MIDFLGKDCFWLNVPSFQQGQESLEKDSRMIFFFQRQGSVECARHFRLRSIIKELSI